MTEPKTEQNISHRGIHFLIIAAALVIVVWGINQAQSVLIVFLLSAFLAVISAPPVLWLERKRIPPVVAVLIVVVGIIIVFLVIGGLVGASLNSFSDAIPTYQKYIRGQALTLKAILASKGIRITDHALLKYINPAALMSLTASMLEKFSLVFSNVVLILLTVTFILLEVSSFNVKLHAIFGDHHTVFPKFKRFFNDIKRYMVIKTTIGLIVGILIVTILSILGVDYPVLWGFLAFLLHYIPNIGPIIAAVPAVLLAFVQLGAGYATITAGVYFVIESIVGYMVEPRLMGQRLGMSTLVVFLSLIFWGSLLGPIGMVLCIPLSMALKFALENNKSTEWIAVLIGFELPPERSSPGIKKKSS